MESAGAAVSRRTVLVTGGGLVLGAVFAGPAVAGRGGGRYLVQSGVAGSAIVHEDGASAVVRRAVAQFRTYVQRVTGVVLPQYSLPGNPPPTDLNPIYIGFIGRESASDLTGIVDGLGDDAFALHPNGRSLTIIGGSDWGTLNGVYAYLEEFAGVRWLMPGPAGEHVPAASTIAKPLEPVVQSPVFVQRMMSPMVDDPAATSGTTAIMAEWAQHNRLQGKHNQQIAFHHNLHTLFPVSEFGATHPEYYAGGVPPAPGATTYWQPAFTEPGTVDVAVSKITQYFAANPSANTFSLGVNDGGGFEEGDPVAAYYGWVNEVVGRVAADHPDKWFGLLAYVELETPPDFPLHPRVVPFFTQDRMAWADAAVATASKGELAQWREVATQIGFYDYTYGSPYVLPRVTPRLSAATYAYAEYAGVVGHYEELYPNWGEGPKPWINARLQWNPGLDVEALLESWCVAAVGSAAAVHLRRYYALWETFWTTDAIASEWFKPQATYQAFNSAGYVEALSAQTLAQARAHVDAMLASPGTPEQQVRAAKLARAFDYYEASAIAYPRSVPALTSESAALSVVDDVSADWQARRSAAQARKDMLTEFESDPILRQPLNALNYGMAWSGWNLHEFWRLVDYLADREPAGGTVTSRLQARAGEQSLFGQFARMLLGISSGGLASGIVNGSFESGAAPWFLWVASTGSLTVTSEDAVDGTSSLRARGITRGGPAQVIPVRPGLLATRAFVKCAGAAAQYKGTVQFNINLQNSAGAQLAVIRSTERRLMDQSGWFAAESLDEIPATVGGVAVARVQYVLVLDNQATDPDLYIDRIAAYQAV